MSEVKVVAQQDYFHLGAVQIAFLSITPPFTSEVYTKAEEVVVGHIIEDRVWYNATQDSIRDGEQLDSPSLTLADREAEQLYYALHRIFGNKDMPTADLRKDYEHEKSRVDKLIDVLITPPEPIIEYREAR